MVHLSIFCRSKTEVNKKKPLTNLVILRSSLSSNTFVGYADSHQTGKVNLFSGNVSKYSYPSLISQQIICVHALQCNGGNLFSVIGLLNSGDLFFFTESIKSLLIIQGPSNLLIPDKFKFKARSMSNIRQIQAFAKQYFKKPETKFMAREPSLEDEFPEEKISFAYKPKIFATPDLSKVLLIGNYTQIYLWQRSDKKSLLEIGNSSKGVWRVFTAPIDQRSPTKQSEAKFCEISYIAKGPRGPLCYIYFGFMTDDILVISTLIISWDTLPTSNSLDPSTEWSQINIPLKDIDEMKNIVNKRGVLVSKVAHKSNFMVICLNTLANKFYLIYVITESKNISVISASYPQTYSSDDPRNHWVVALNFTEDNSFVIGCLKSGQMFISTRIGQLLQIFCENLPMATEPLIFVPLCHDFSRKNAEEDDVSKSSDGTSVAGRPKFNILFLTTETDKFLISSGFKFYLFSLPKDLAGAKDVTSFLLKQTHLANHELQMLCNEHQYDYIHCSSWRLARSLIEINQLNQNDNQINQNDNKRIKNNINLWLPGSLPDKSASTSIPLTDVEKQMAETFRFLLSSWSFLSSSPHLSRNQNKSLTKAAISETLKLLETVLVASPVAGDHEEHQVRLIQSLRLYHQLIKTFATNAYPSHMLKPILKLTHKYFHLVMLSTTESSEMKLAYVLVLSQTLISVEKICNQRFLFIFHRTRKLWFCLYKCLSAIWKKAQLSDSRSFHIKLRSVTELIQCRVLEHSKYYTTKINQEFKVLASGKLKTGLEKLMQKIENYINTSVCNNTLKKLFSYGFYSLVINNDLETMIKFVCWSAGMIVRKLSELTIDEKKEKRLRKVLQSLFGNLGIVISRSILVSSNIMKEILAKNDISIPPEYAQEMKGLQLDGKSAGIMSTALICLIIGGKWSCISFLARIKRDVKLSLFAAMASIENESFRPRIEDIIEDALSSYSGTAIIAFSSSDFRIIQDLLQVAAMSNVEVLPTMLNKCLERMEHFVNELPLHIHDGFALPSPPWFCPQFEIEETYDSNEVDWQNEPYSYHKELLVRKEVWRIIHFFCVLVSASGLSSLFIVAKLEELETKSAKRSDLDFTFSSLRSKKVNKNQLKSSNSWNELMIIWNKFLEIIWSLQTRDKVNLHLREWIIHKVTITQMSLLQERSSNLLQFCYKFASSQNYWHNDIFNLAISAAFDASPTLETVHALVSVASSFKLIPSLSKYRLNFLLELWKGIKLKDRDDPGTQGWRSLHECFECEFEKCIGLNGNLPKSGHLEDTTEFLNQFLGMTLVKMEELYEIAEIPLPFLSQFGSQIRDLESSCRKLVSDLISFPEHSESDQINASPIDLFDPSRLNDSITNKKGFFKNSKHYSGNNMEFGTEVFYWQNSSQVSVQRQSRRSHSSQVPVHHLSRRSHSSHLITEKEKIFKKRSLSLNSFNCKDRIHCRRIELKPNIPTNNVKNSVESSNRISKFFALPFFQVNILQNLSENFENMALWIADDRRQFLMASQKFKCETSDHSVIPLLTNRELRHAINWIALHKSTKQASHDISDCRVIRTKILADNPTIHSFNKNNEDQLNMDLKITSALSKDTAINSKLPSTGAENEGSILQKVPSAGAKDKKNTVQEVQYTGAKNEISIVHTESSTVAGDEEIVAQKVADTGAKDVETIAQKKVHQYYDGRVFPSKLIKGKTAADDVSESQKLKILSGRTLSKDGIRDDSNLINDTLSKGVKGIETPKQCNHQLSEASDRNPIFNADPKDYSVKQNSASKGKETTIKNNGISQTRKGTKLDHSGFWNTNIEQTNNAARTSNSPKVQSNGNFNPWEPFSLLTEENSKSATERKVSDTECGFKSESSVELFGYKLINCPQLPVMDNEKLSHSDNSILSENLAEQKLANDTLDDITLSESCPKSIGIIQEPPNKQATRNIDSKNRKPKHYPENNENDPIFKKVNRNKFDEVKDLDFRIDTVPSCIFLKVPKLTADFEAEPLKWTLKQIPNLSWEPRSSQWGASSPFTLLKVPSSEKERSAAKEPVTSRNLKLMDHATVLAHYQRINKIQSCKANLNTSKSERLKPNRTSQNVWNDKSLSTKAHMTESKLSVKNALEEKAVQTTTIISELGARINHLKEQSTKYVQTCDRTEAKRTNILSNKSRSTDEIEENVSNPQIISDLNEKDETDNLTEYREKLRKLQSVRPKVSTRNTITEQNINDNHLIDKVQQTEAIQRQETNDCSTQTSDLKQFNVKIASAIDNRIKSVHSSAIENKELSSDPSIIADHLGVQNVAVDLCQPIRDIFQNSGTGAHVIDIPENAVRNKLNMFREDLEREVNNEEENKKIKISNENSYIANERTNNGCNIIRPRIERSLKEERNLDYTSLFPSEKYEKSTEILQETDRNKENENCIEIPDDANPFGAQQTSSRLNLQQKTEEDIINMFLVGDLSATDVCNFLKDSKVEECNGSINSEIITTKEKLSKLIHDASTTRADITESQDLLAKVDAMVDTIIDHEVKQFNRTKKLREEYRTQPSTQKRIQGNKEQPSTERDFISYIEQLSQRNLKSETVNYILEVLDNNWTKGHNKNIHSPPTRSTSSPNFLLSTDATENQIGFQTNPILHLDLTCFGSEVSPSSNSPPKTAANSPETSRRTELRAWMKRRRLQRKKEFEQAKPKQKTDVKDESRNTSSAAICLTGRQIRERSQTFEMHRILLREEHSRSRGEQVENIFRSLLEEKKSLFNLKKSATFSRKGPTQVHSPPESTLNVKQPICRDATERSKLENTNSTEIKMEVDKLSQILTSEKRKKTAKIFLEKTPKIPNVGKFRSRIILPTGEKSTFPLDRISEIDSENSTASAQSVENPEESLSSTGSSWKMPENIKNILHQN